MGAPAAFDDPALVKRRKRALAAFSLAVLTLAVLSVGFRPVESAPVPIERVATTRLDVVAPEFALPSTSLHFQVTASVDGHPLPFVQVEVRLDGAVLALLETDAEGKVAASVPSGPMGRHTVVLSVGPGASREGAQASFTFLTILTPAPPWKVTAEKLGAHVLVRWDHAEDGQRPVDNFNVYRKRNGGEWTHVTTLEYMQREFRDPAPSGWIEYAVGASNGVGEGDWAFSEGLRV